ncbi:MAG: hypothetical protein QM607_09775 [Microbacterium sp.]
MAALVLRIRAASLFRWFRAIPGHALRRVVLAVLVLLGVAGLCTLTLRLDDVRPADAASTLVVAGTAGLLCFAFVPALVGARDPLAPRAFRTLGREPGPTAATLALAALVSAPTWLLIAFDACCAAVWMQLGAPTALAIAGAAGHVVACVLAARMAMAVRAEIESETATDASRLLIAALLALSVPGVIVAVSFGALRATGSFDRVAQLLAVTPFGALSGIPATAIDDWEQPVWLTFVVAILTVLLLGAAWWLVVRRAMTVHVREGSTGGARGLGWFGVLPSTATGAIAARSLVYWLRDSRYLTNALIIPIGSVLPVVPLLVAGVPVSIAALIPVPLMALFYGWLPHNDLAYDSSALWLHIATGSRGIADRAGRLAPVLVIAVPVLAAATALAILFSGESHVLLPLIGIECALLLSGLGLSSIASVVAPYAVARPGDSAFRQPQRSGSGAVWSQVIVLVGAILISGWTLWQATVSIGDGGMDGTRILWQGIATGAATLLVGIGIGALVFSRRGSRLMEFASAS